MSQPPVATAAARRWRDDHPGRHPRPDPPDPAAGPLPAAALGPGAGPPPDRDGGRHQPVLRHTGGAPGALRDDHGHPGAARHARAGVRRHPRRHHRLAGRASLLTVIRHTRSDEEAGRRELLGSTVVGRNAPLTAALLVTLAADLVLGAVLAAGMVGLGLPATGSVAYGLSVAAAGWMFAAVGAVAAQLTDGAGGARGLALGTLGLAYLLRAAGDTSGSDGGLGWLSWLSPIGWTQQTRAYADERWWVFVLVLASVVVLAAAAYAVLARRDVGAGVLPARLGPATAAPGLRSPLALAWRLHRGSLLG